MTSPIGHLPRRVRFDAPLAVVVLLAIALFAVWTRRTVNPAIAFAPLPIAAGISLVRRSPAIWAAGLPAVVVLADGYLVHINRQTPFRISTAIVAVLLWTVLTGRTTFHPRATGMAAWLMLLLLANYALIALPTGRAIDYQVLALLLEGLVICAVVATVSPHPHLVLLSLGIAGLTASYFSYFPEYETGGRPFALGLDPNFLGTILAVGIAALATLSRVRKSWIVLLPLAPMIGALIQVQSRSATLAAIVGLVGAISLSPVRLRGFLILAAAAAFGLSGYLLGIEPGFGPFTERRIDTSESVEVREKITQVNVEAVKSAPFVGVGLGLVAERAERSQVLRKAAVSHNEYLRLAAEVGVIALAGALTLLGLPFLVGIAGTNRRTAGALMWPSLATVLVSMAFLNVLDNAQLATLAMSITGTAWSSVAGGGSQVRSSSRLRLPWGGAT